MQSRNKQTAYNIMETLKTSAQVNEVNEVQTMNLIVRVTQPDNGTEFELELDNVSEGISLSQAVGASVQRLTDYLRLYKRNNSKLVDSRKDVLISVFIVSDGDRVNWISERVQQAFKFKYRASTSEKGAKRLSCRIYDVVTFAQTPFKVVAHDKVS